MVPVSESFVSYIAANGLRADAPVSPGQGFVQGRAVSQVPTDSAAGRLAERSEPSRIASRLSQLIPSFAPSLEWIKRFLGLDTLAKPETFEPRSVARRELPEEIVKACREQAMISSVPALSCAEKLKALSGAQLKSLYINLSLGRSGEVRRVTTSLENLRQFGPEGLDVRAGELLERKVGGLAFSQWGTTGSQGPESFLNDALEQPLQAAAREFSQVVTEILQLRDDIESLQAEPKKSAGPVKLGEQLLKGSGEILSEILERLAELDRVNNVVPQKVGGSRAVSPRMRLLDNMFTDMASRAGTLLSAGPPRHLEGDSGSGWGIVEDKALGFRPVLRKDFAKLVDDLRSIGSRDDASRLELKRLLDEEIAGTRVLDWRFQKDDGDNGFSWEVRQQFSEWAGNAIQLIEANKK